MVAKRTRAEAAGSTLRDLVGGEPALTIDEVNARYPGEWILLLVTDYDEDGSIARGQVAGHSMRERDLLRLDRQVRAAAPGAMLLIYQAGNWARTGEEARRILAAAGERWTDKRAWW